MYIMTNYRLQDGLIQVLDTKDKTNEVVSLKTLSCHILSGKIKVHGIGVLKPTTNGNIIPLHAYGIYLDEFEARNQYMKWRNKL